MGEAGLIVVVLIGGAIGGAALALLAWLLSRFVNDVVGRIALAIGVFVAAGAYLWFAIIGPSPRIWILIELLQVVVFGAMGLAGWKGPVRWLLLAWLLHPVWDFVLHYLGPGRSFTPVIYSLSCITFDWIVAAYIFSYYLRANRPAPSHAR